MTKEALDALKDAADGNLPSSSSKKLRLSTTNLSSKLQAAICTKTARAIGTRKARTGNPVASQPFSTVPAPFGAGTVL